MDAVDAVNRRWGRGSLSIGSTGLRKPWSTAFKMRSPRFTTRVDELPLV
jgi:DNA polymerase V